MPYKDPDQRRAYHRAYHRQWYARNSERIKAKVAKRKQAIRAWFDEYKATLSCPCGENHTACIVFHHRDPNIKDVGIAEMIYTKGWGKERMLEEISKCDVMCANCHRKLHAGIAHSAESLPSK